MIVGLPKEVKDNEYRVGLVPAGVKALTGAGHKVIVQKSAGEGSGILDEEFVQAGGEILDTAEEVWSRANMVVKVKEPVASEYGLLREDLILFTYLHLAPARELTRAMIGSGVIGTNAAKMAVGLGAAVIIIDRDLERLRYLDDIFGSRIRTLASNPYTIAESVAASDLVVGAVLVPGAAAPKLVTREMLKAMPRHSVIVDVAVDQGGCIETTKPTTHSAPTYYVENVLHYGVTNMPGAVPRTSTV